MQHGTVKWFNESKGYGFIEAQNQQYFVHYKHIQGNGYKTLKEGDQVTFDSEKTPKGLSATNVIPKNWG